MDRILRIDVGTEGGPAFREDPLGSYAGLGGRALTSAIVHAEVPADCPPLGPGNKLVLAPGLLTGTAAASSGRLSVGCKSPLTGGIKEANAGGAGAQVLARLGYAAVVLEGERRGDDLYKVMISTEGVRVEKDNELKLLTNYQLMDRFSTVYGKKGAMISIGTAGEMGLANSTVAVTDMEGRPTRHAGRGGVGAVMGSKGIKVILLDGRGTRNREPKDPEAFKDASQRFVEGLRTHPITGRGLPTYGTNSLTNLLSEVGGYPTRNFRQGRYEDADKISGESQVELTAQRGGKGRRGCHRGCVIQCSGTYLDKNGQYLTKRVQYETVWAHGGNCGISDLDAIAQLDHLDDDYGLDTIEMGVAIGLAMEAGLLPFGDGEGAIELVHEVGKGTRLGRILGSGAAFTAKALGIERAPVVKGQAIPAYDPRAVKGMGVTYATSPQGADHTAGYAVAANILKVGGNVDPLSAAGQAELSRDLQALTATVDSTGMCLFIVFAVLDQPETLQALVDLLNAFHGLTLTGDDVAALGKSVLERERDFNRRAGFTAEDDRLPGFFRVEKLAPHDVEFDVPEEELDKVSRE